MACSSGKDNELPNDAALKYYGAFYEMPLTDIQPKGWLKKYLELQRDGLTGHLDEGMGGYPFNSAGWTDTVAVIDPNSPYSPWYTYEQNGYWIDGLIRTGLLLGDSFLIKKANKSLDYSLNHAASDGFIGSSILRKPYQTNRWVHTVFFRAMQAKYAATKDNSIPEKLRKHYLCDISSFPYTHIREVANIEHMLWVYAATGDVELLKHAERIYKEGNLLNKNRGASGIQFDNPYSFCLDHGVTYNESAKLGAILYLYTGNPAYLTTSVNAYKKIDQHYMLVDGVNSSTEIVRGKDPLDSHETCDISEFIWSNGYLLAATGTAEYADKIEKAAFNAAPGCVTSDFKALQYFSCPNQVLATRNSNHNYFFQGNTGMQFTSNSWVKCCAGEVSKIMPNYIARMWMKNKSGPVAATYGPSSVSVEIEGEKVYIEEDTYYPFSDTIRFTIKTEHPLMFDFTFRIPGWCSNAQAFYNGKKIDQTLSAGTFIPYKNSFKNGDVIQLVLPQSLRMSTWPQDGIAIERGPLVYSLKLNETYTPDLYTGETPAPQQVRYNVTTNSPWNYALHVRADNLEEKVKVIFHKNSDTPWSVQSAPIELQVPAYRLNNWKPDIREVILREDFYASERKGLLKKWNVLGDTIKGHYVFTPQIPKRDETFSQLSGTPEIISLIPYGCAKLRITIFPQSRYDGITEIEN